MLRTFREPARNGSGRRNPVNCQTGPRTRCAVPDGVQMRSKPAFMLLLGAAALAQSQGDIEKLAPYYPTPETIVQRMLQMGGLKAGEKMFDLGSGDGRIVIVAAQKFHAQAVGIELDKDLFKQSA